MLETVLLKCRVSKTLAVKFDNGIDQVPRGFSSTSNTYKTTSRASRTAKARVGVAEPNPNLLKKAERRPPSFLVF